MATKKKTEPKTDAKAVKEEVIEESVKAAEIEEKLTSEESFIARKLTAINNLNNPAKARRYAKWLFRNKRGIK